MTAQGSTAGRDSQLKAADSEYEDGHQQNQTIDDHQQGGVRLAGKFVADEGQGPVHPGGDGVGRAFFERFGDETVAVEGIAPQGEEDGVRFDPARVGRDAGILTEMFV